MPSPVYAAGAPCNLIDGVSVAKGTTVAAFLDVSNRFEEQVTCEMTTDGTAPPAGTTFAADEVYGNSSANTFSSAASAGATSITVSASAGLHTGPGVMLHPASGSKFGEVVTVSGATASDGTPMVPDTFPFDPGGATAGTRYLPR